MAPRLRLYVAGLETGDVAGPSGQKGTTMQLFTISESDSVYVHTYVNAGKGKIDRDALWVGFDPTDMYQGSVSNPVFISPELREDAMTNAHEIHRRAGVLGWVIRCEFEARDGEVWAIPESLDAPQDRVAIKLALRIRGQYQLPAGASVVRRGRCVKRYYVPKWDSVKTFWDYDEVLVIVHPGDVIRYKQGGKYSADDMVIFIGADLVPQVFPAKDLAANTGQLKVSEVL